MQEKKPPRVRKPRGKQPDPEPVILTLSSDEEDSNSSMMSNQVNNNAYKIYVPININSIYFKSFFITENL